MEQMQSSVKKPSRTKKKDPPTKVEEPRQMRSKSEERRFSKVKTAAAVKAKQVWPLTPENCSAKLLKKFLKKTEAYNR